MSNVVPAKTKLAHQQNEYNSVGDMNMVTTLLKNPRYVIPDHLRKRVIGTAESILSNVNATVAEAISAAKLVLEADKVNVALIKLQVPKQIEHFNARNATTEELVEVIKKAQALMPPLPSEIIDA